MNNPPKDQPNANNTPLLTHLRSLLVHAIEMIDKGECKESHAYSMLNRFNAESHGFVSKNSVVNYDQAMKILGIKSRNKFRNLCVLYCIEQVKINNMPIGFLRSEIEDLAYQLKEKKNTYFFS